MAQVEFRGALLTTSSALALILGIGAAQAGPATPCAVNNTFAGLPNSGAINCVSFNDGANHTGDVINNNTGTITPTGTEGGVPRDRLRHQRPHYRDQAHRQHHQ
jgi:hypothetical protein